MKTKILEVATHYPGSIQDKLDSLGEEWKLENYTPLVSTRENNDGNVLSSVKIGLLICRKSERIRYKYKVESLNIDKAERKEGLWLADLTNDIISRFELEGWNFVLMVPYINLGRTKAYYLIFSQEQG